MLLFSCSLAKGPKKALWTKSPLLCQGLAGSGGDPTPESCGLARRCHACWLLARAPRVLSCSQGHSPGHGWLPVPTARTGSPGSPLPFPSQQHMPERSPTPFLSFRATHLEQSQGGRQALPPLHSSCKHGQRLSPAVPSHTPWCPEQHPLLSQALGPGCRCPQVVCPQPGPPVCVTDAVGTCRTLLCLPSSPQQAGSGLDRLGGTRPSFPDPPPHAPSQYVSLR